MKIQVRYFARLREDLPHAPTEMELASGATVLDVWCKATAQMAQPANVLCAVNMDYVGWSRTIADGDEVAFFPPVTGG